MNQASTKKLENAKIQAEIAKLMAETAKLNKELRWYEVTIVVAMTLPSSLSPSFFSNRLCPASAGRYPHEY